MKSQIISEKFLIFLVIVLSVFSYKVLWSSLRGLINFNLANFDNPIFEISNRILSILIPLFVWTMLFTKSRNLLFSIQLFSLLLSFISFQYLYYAYQNILQHELNMAYTLTIQFIVYLTISILLLKFSKKNVKIV